jgi:hypothetical protein
VLSVTSTYGKESCACRWNNWYNPFETGSWRHPRFRPTRFSWQEKGYVVKECGLCSCSLPSASKSPEHCAGTAPESVCLIMVAALRSQERQVPTGQMAVDSQVDAPKLLGAFERQDSPAIFGDRAGRWDSESGGVACPSRDEDD